MLMRNTALATEDEYDEVTVSSLEVLETKVAALGDGLNEMKKDLKSFMEKVDRNFERLSTKIDSGFDSTNARIDVTNKEVSELAKAVIRTDSKLNALLWVFAVLGAVIPLGFSLGKTFNWF